MTFFEQPTYDKFYLRKSRQTKKCVTKQISLTNYLQRFSKPSSLFQKITDQKNQNCIYSQKMPRHHPVLLNRTNSDTSAVVREQV
ncbi:hypothetical protein SPOG_05489 [Schizosaccharomyces cryophilus OY26]|uniref:Uncharacterized protein n=1 Tax=Schizosaccharomyces cryophilus (strain OY26 / ATCC MYA-4695 / CBS 11777 / NBRC 106824 / NRRL Y48691) TaxID=653667 RepID=S9X7H6_SCHCR|nr:uncharacterized protein SPOG_05489 [Schizosaccharomyces cryophilus OY26]EPY53047.1 hypothetical protein SPOG_05489 [Schizosaccharomyces cryophilus OY26]